MKARMIAGLTALALVLTACGSSGPTPAQPGTEPGATGAPGAGTGPTGATGGGEKGSKGSQVDPENAPPPEVQATTPPEGGRLSPVFTVEARGSDPNDTFPRPTLLLVRNASAGQQAADRTPAPGAAEVIRRWNAYAERALVAVFPGAQPDAAHSVVVEQVAIEKKGRRLIVFVRVEAGKKQAAQVTSLPWAVISVPAGEVAKANECFLAINQALQPAEC